MSKKSIGETTNEIYDLLKDHESTDRSKILSAVKALCGDVATLPPIDSPPRQEEDPDQQEINAGDYIAQKQAETKMDLLAVAARYLETKRKQSEYSQEQLESLIKEGRQNFDSENFKTDMRNAKAKGVFVKNTGKGIYKLSYGGREYADLLPDKKEARKKLKPGTKRPRKTTTKKSKPKKVTKK